MTAAVAGAAVALGRLKGATSVEAAAGQPVLQSVNNTTSGGTTTLAKDATVPGSGLLVINGNGDGIGAIGTAVGVSTLGVSHGVFAATNTANGTGVLGQINAANGFGVLGTSGFASTGVWGNSSGGVGVLGISSATHAVFGSASVASSAGVFGQNDGANGTGVNGKSNGGIGLQGTSTSGTGLLATSETNTALVARSTSGKAAQLFGDVEITGNFTASGMKSAAVKVADGSVRRMYCLESPVSYFEDMGSGQLTGGSGSVSLDPLFLSTVSTDDYQVYLTPEGDCRGLYVESKSATGFAVGELMGGTSTIKFSWRVVAKRTGIPNERFAPVSMSLDKASGPKPTSQREVQLPTLPPSPNPVPDRPR